MSDQEVFDAIHAEEDDRLLADIVRDLIYQGCSITSWTRVPGAEVQFGGRARLSGPQLGALKRASQKVTAPLR